MNDPHLLTDLQIAIMRVLWNRGQATAAEICEALRPERGLAQTTVATLLTRLEKRGVVQHQTRARQYMYSPTVTQSDVRRSMVSELTERLFDGDVAALMSHLLSAREMSPGDLARVRELIAAHDAGSEGSHDDA
ncbi:MAG: BlaI/MecI/CopY family transcriptional regulator [Gemmatimonadales bacterium]